MVANGLSTNTVDPLGMTRSLMMWRPSHSFLLARHRDVGGGVVGVGGGVYS